MLSPTFEIMIMAVKQADEEAGHQARPQVNIADIMAKMQPPVLELAVGGAAGALELPVGVETATVRYRVRRIEKLLSTSLGDPEVRLLFSLGLGPRIALYFRGFSARKS